MAPFPLYRPLSPPYGIALCYISFIFHQLVQLLNFIMIFNAILSVNHLVIYTQFNNLLFPRKSCSIGYRYPLESIHPVRKPNVVIFAHCPLIILPFYPIIILPFVPIICAPTIAHKQSHTMCFAAPTFFFNASK